MNGKYIYGVIETSETLKFCRVKTPHAVTPDSSLFDTPA